MTKLQYHSTAPAPADGASVEPQSDSRGNQKVTLVASGQTQALDATGDNGDAVSSTGNNSRLVTNARNWLYNGASFDRARNNTDLTILSSAARTATNQSADFTNYNGRGLHLVIDATAIAATPSVVFTIQGKDAISGKYYTILTSAAVTAVSTTILRVFPGATAAANTVANDILPRVWRIDATHGDADSITYSVGASGIL